MTERVRAILVWVSMEAAWFAAILLASVAAGALVMGLGGRSETAVLLGFHAAMVAASTWRARRDLRSWFRPSWRAVGWGITTGAGMVVTGAAWGSLLRLVGVEPPDVAATLAQAVPWPAVLLAWGAGLVPLAEELYFRGVLSDAAFRRIGRYPALAVTAVAFAAVHGLPVFVPAYLAFAWALWLARERTGGLVAPVIAHALNNVIGLVLPGV